MKQREPNKVIYIHPVRNEGKVHIQKPGGHAYCGARLRYSIKKSSLDSGSLCQNCVDRMEGKGFGKQAIK